MNKINVLYISPNGFLGGAERFVLNTTVAHKNSKKILPIYLFLNSGVTVELCEANNQKIIVLPFKFKYSNFISLIKTIVFIINIVKNENIKVIHATMPYAQILASIATLFTKVKTIWFQHGPVGGTLDQIANLLPVDMILFNSKYLQKTHNKMFRAKRHINDQLIINFGIIKENSKTTNNIFNNNNKIKCILAGRICEWKGQLTLLKCLNLFKNKKMFEFFIIGSPNNKADYKYLETLNKYHKDHNLENVVKFIEHTNNIYDYMNQADILLHTSTIPEPFGLVVAEAMLNGCFVIGSNEGGVTDILRHLKTGITFDSCKNNAHLSLCESLNLYLELSIKDRKDIVLNSKHLIEKYYSIEQLSEQLESIYFKVIKE